MISIRHREYLKSADLSIMQSLKNAGPSFLKYRRCLLHSFSINDIIAHRKKEHGGRDT